MRALHRRPSRHPARSRFGRRAVANIHATGGDVARRSVGGSEKVRAPIRVAGARKDLDTWETPGVSRHRRGGRSRANASDTWRHPGHAPGARGRRDRGAGHAAAGAGPDRRREHRRAQVHPEAGSGRSRPITTTPARGCMGATASAGSSLAACAQTIATSTRCWTSSGCRSNGARRSGRTSTERYTSGSKRPTTWRCAPAASRAVRARLRSRSGSSLAGLHRGQAGRQPPASRERICDPIAQQSVRSHGRRVVLHAPPTEGGRSRPQLPRTGSPELLRRNETDDTCDVHALLALGARKRRQP